MKHLIERRFDFMFKSLSILFKFNAPKLTQCFSSLQCDIYRDEIGNISTSNLYETDESVDFEIRPRYPLFGGWKTSYYIGYNLPSYNYLYNKGMC